MDAYWHWFGSSLMSELADLFPHDHKMAAPAPDITVTFQQKVKSKNYVHPFYEATKGFPGTSPAYFLLRLICQNTID